MPSPFPGMDPFLEHPDVFPDLHDSFIVYLRETIQAQLPAPYYADIGNRVWIEMSKRSIGPDVKIMRPRTDTNGGVGHHPAGGGGVALAVATEPVVVHVPHDQFRESFVEIHTREGKKRLVTHLEVLSPANKSPGEHGRDLYVRKQREILGSQAHLVEIDLLRGGNHSTAVPLEHALARTGPFDYHVCLHRFDNFEDYFVYPILLQTPLPTVAIPLLPDDGSVTVNLQTVLNRCYDAGQYGRIVNYAQDAIVPPLDAERAAWVQERLGAQGLLPPPATP